MSEPAEDSATSVEDDELDTSSAPLLVHLTELRSRLMWSLLAVSATSLVSFFFAAQIYNILLVPFADAAEAVRSRSGEAFKLELIFTAPLEFFFAKLKLSLFAGIIISFPVIAFHVYRFVAPGLYKTERAAFAPFLIATPVLFSLGASFVYFVMLPMVMRFALGQEQTGPDGTQIQLLASVKEYLSLVMALILAFGLSFQLPVLVSLAGQSRTGFAFDAAHRT